MSNIKDIFGFALQNVGRRKKRAFLTMLGIFIGIAAVVALVALGQGLQYTINQQFEKVGADKIIIQAKELGFGGEFAPGQLKKHELNIIEKTAGVRRVAGQLFRGASVRFGDIQRTQYVMSIPDKRDEVDLVTQVNAWEIGEGRLLTANDKMKTVLGYEIARGSTFEKDIKLGNKIWIKDESFEVVGILKQVGDPGMDRSLIVSEEDARRLLNESEAYSYIIAQTAADQDPEEVAARVEKAIRRDRHLDEGKEDFNVQTSTELISSFNSVLNIIQIVFVGIAAISLLVGGIGIMNTMYTAVLERTREIGVMKAIGARNSDVLSMFLAESGLLGLVGGGVGVAVGIGISKVVELGVNAAFGEWTLIVFFPWYLILGVLLFSSGVGVVSGVFPAYRASKLAPVDALRYE